MKKLLFFLGLLALLHGLADTRDASCPFSFPAARAQGAAQAAFQDGDIIFQTSLSGQSLAIQIATNSKYSHCGVLYREKDGWHVFEAARTVRATPLAEWIARGEGGHYVVKRLKNAGRVLTAANLVKLRRVGAGFAGKPYDLAFSWTDEKMYCSELVWKMYQRATGLEIGKLARLGDFDLSNPIVQAKVRKRWGGKLPADEIVISPTAIFDSGLLETVEER